jgi:hypothetical protein
MKNINKNGLNMRDIAKIFAFVLLMYPVFIYGQQNPNSLSFDGSNDYVYLGSSSLLKPATALTVEAWVNFSNWNATGNQVIISNFNGQGYMLRLQSGSLVASVYRNGSVGTATYNVRTLTGWHHVAFTFNGRNTRLYTDGVLRNSNNARATYPIVYNPAYGTYLGSSAGATSEFINGRIDEVRVWSVARSANQLSNNMYTEISVPTTGLVAYYRFNQGNASAANAGLTLLTDLTANAINGTLNGFALTGATSNWVSGYTLKPIDQSTTVTYNNGTSTQLTVNWVRPGANKGGNSVLVFMRQTTSGTSAPVDGTNYTANTIFKSGTQIGTTGWYCVYSGSGTSVTVTGLTANTTYRTQVIEAQVITGLTTRYSTATGTGNPANGITYVAPTTQASNVSISNITSNSFNATWSRGNGTSRIVVVKETNASTANPLNNTTYTASATYKSGTQIGTTGWYCVYNGTGTTVAITGLSSGTTYRVMVIDYNGIAGLEKYCIATGANNPLNTTTTIAAPTVQASNIVASSVTLSSLTLDWTRGSGSNCAVYVTQNTTGSAVPVNNTTYSASNIYGIGSQIGTTGWYCVYNGTGTNVSVTGLSAATDYRIMVCEYNGSAGNEKYNTSINTNNPFNISTQSFTTWNGTTWDNGTPGQNSDAIISGDYSLPTNIVCRGLAINSGFTVNVLPGNSITVYGNLINNGTLALKTPTNNTPSGSLITYMGITNNGVMTAERYISQGSLSSTNYVWHNMSAPVADYQAELTYKGDYVCEYLEGTNQWRNLKTGDNIAAGKGYLIKTINAGGKSIVYSGTFNSGNQSINLTNTGGTTTNGYNLIGNPYPSAIDWEATSGWSKTNITGTIWIWNPVLNTYATWNGTVGTNGGSRYIPAMQGFLVRVATGYTTGNVSMTNSVRTHNTQQFLKSAELKPEVIRLKAAGNEISDEVVIYKAEGENDGDKLFSVNPNVPQLYVINDDVLLSVLKVNPNVQISKVELGFKCDVDGEYAIHASELSFEGISSMYLVDNLNNDTIKLSSGSIYNFSHYATNDEDRFTLLMNKSASVINASSSLEAGIWSYNKAVTVSLNNNLPANIEVYNIMGVKVNEFNYAGSDQFKFELPKSGIYIVKLSQNGKSKVQKLSIR